jgi:hypothetical protein
MFAQQLSDPAVTGAEQFGEIAVGEQPSLLVRLLAEPDCLAQHPLRSRESIDAHLHVLGGGDIKKYRDQVDVGDALPSKWSIVDAHAHPKDLPVQNVLFGTHVLEDNLKNHLGA